MMLMWTAQRLTKLGVQMTTKPLDCTHFIAKGTARTEKCHVCLTVHIDRRMVETASCVPISLNALARCSPHSSIPLQLKMITSCLMRPQRKNRRSSLRTRWRAQRDPKGIVSRRQGDLAAEVGARGSQYLFARVGFEGRD
ncbi:hypothetical protein L210DRAFT_3568649 [Boletus edulis BED1]|uniref:Uncharacterized protein n=1 Tax=Boletus edulis BED1 TaxID=1328754 RepID=A0AAD4BF05_BOLED|nr:hypothetical protein L210DRAFT_3568649 [Boletus edulis BED1]